MDFQLKSSLTYSKDSFKKPEKRNDQSARTPFLNYLPLIEDPLWKMVYKDILDVLGGLGAQLWNCKLGSVVAKNKTLDLYCPTKEIAKLVEQYSFLILGSLKKYFPALKGLRVTY